MSRFAIFYNDEDAAKIASLFTRNDLTTQEKQLIQKIWNGGLKDWASAQVAISPCDDPNLPFDGKRIEINAQGVTRQDLVDLLMNVGTRLGHDAGGYLTTLSLDLAQCGVDL